MFADKIDISFVVRMNRDTGVGDNRFRPGGGDFQKPSRLFDNFVASII